MKSWGEGGNAPCFPKFRLFLVKRSEENVFLGVFWCWICTDEDITSSCFTSLGYWKVTPPCLIGRVTPLAGETVQIPEAGERCPSRSPLSITLLRTVYINRKKMSFFSSEKFIIAKVFSPPCREVKADVLCVGLC